MAWRTFNPIIEEIHFPPDPFDAFKTIKRRSHPFFLDSSCDFMKLGAFSFLGCEPFLVFKCRRDDVTLEWADGRIENFKSNPFSALKKILKQFNLSDETCLPAGKLRQGRQACLPAAEELPLLCGAVGYFSYDMKDFVEEVPSLTRDDMGLPDCILGFYDCVIVYDNHDRKAYIASSGLPDTELAKREAKARARLKEMRAALAEPRRPNGFPGIITPASQPESNFQKLHYLKAVEKAKEYIRKGDIYQVNLSQRFRTRLNMEVLDLYSRLRAMSPAPFAAYLDFGEVAILSSSPERFLLKRGDYIETRPIKGTRPRGRNVFNDRMLEIELRESRKDRAEHVMIVDLERNDLGRICEYGSVRPTEFVIMERYKTVFHLVSTVSGRLKKGVEPVDCLLAAFPGGSITGAPKIRAMEIIEELEPVKRGIYTGAIGYLDFRGNMDTSIAIRTFVIKGGDVCFHVGGGIVADSIPEKEYEETLDKAKGLVLSLGLKPAGGTRRFVEKEAAPA